MQKFALLSALCIILAGSLALTQKEEVVPKLLLPEVTLKAQAWSFTPAISKDGKTMMLVRWDNPNFLLADQSIQKLYKSTFENGSWSRPVEVAATRGNRVDFPHYSPDGKYFYISYNKYHDKQYNYPNEKGWDDFDIWKAPCNEHGDIDWTRFAPITYGEINRAKTPRNSNVRYVHNETSPRADLAGNLYFWSERLDMGIGRRDIFCYHPQKGTTRVLPEPINSKYKESGVSISADGQKMIFASERPGGLGESDLYFTQKQADGSWGKPVNLGAQVNSKQSEGGPQFVNNDTQLIFTSSRDIPGYAPIDCGEGLVTYAVYTIAVKDIEVMGR